MPRTPTTATAHDETTKQAVNFKLCAPAVTALRALASRHGVTMTALVDALAHRGAELERTEVFQAAVLDGRGIDAERRTRA